MRCERWMELVPDTQRDEDANTLYCTVYRTDPPPQSGEDSVRQTGHMSVGLTSIELLCIIL